MENKDYLKKLEEIHSKKFKNDKGYLDSCKANKDLNPKDYKIQPNHKLDEYFSKYGKRLENGKLLAFKKDELWLMNKNKKYWEIKNESDFIYFEVSSNLKPLWISLASLVAVAGITAGVYFGVFANKVKADDEGGEEGGGEVDPGPGDDIIEIRLKSGAFNVISSWSGYDSASIAINDNKIQEGETLSNVDITVSFEFYVNLHKNGASSNSVKITTSEFSDKYGNLDIPPISYTATPVSGTIVEPPSPIMVNWSNYEIHEYLEIGSVVVANP